MSNNLPAKRGSRAVQRQHVRRYKSGKIKRINIGVKKIDVKPVVQRFDDRVKTFSDKSLVAAEKRGLVDRRKFVVPSLAKKQKFLFSDVIKSLPKGSFLVNNIVLKNKNSAFETMNSFTCYDIKEDITRTIHYEIRWAEDWLKFAIFLNKRGRPVIIHPSDWADDFMSSVEFLPGDIPEHFEYGLGGGYALSQDEKNIFRKPLKTSVFDDFKEARKFESSLRRDKRSVLSYNKFNPNTSEEKYYVEDHGDLNE